MGFDLCSPVRVTIDVLMLRDTDKITSVRVTRTRRGVLAV